MSDDIIAIYVLLDDLLQSLNHREDSRRKMSDAEILTLQVVACSYFGGNYAQTGSYLQSEGYMPQMLGASRLSRRIHQLSDLSFQLMHILGMAFIDQHASKRFIIDSFPVAVCHNIRIKSSKLLDGEQFRGKCASKREYFYGFKVFLIATDTGLPVEWALLPGRYAETKGLDLLPIHLPEGSELYGDSGFTNYLVEDLAKELDDIEFNICRKKNSKRGDSFPIYLCKKEQRRYIETVFSMITRRFPKKIHAVSIQGFILKVFFFIIAHAIHQWMAL